MTWGKLSGFLTNPLIYDRVAKSVQDFGERPILFAYKSDPEALVLPTFPAIIRF